MRNSTRAVFGLAGTVALLGSFALPASAADSTTTTTVTGGTVSIAAPLTLALPDVKPGATSTGTLSGVKVTDERAGTAGWVAKVSISNFVGTGTTPPTIAATNVTYTPGTATVTGTATVSAAATAANISTSTTVQTASAVTGNNTATWDASVAVTAPSDALADDYTATMTHSVA